MIFNIYYILYYITYIFGHLYREAIFHQVKLIAGRVIPHIFQGLKPDFSGHYANIVGFYWRALKFAWSFRCKTLDIG